jgi:hypothetical protein
LLSSGSSTGKGRLRRLFCLDCEPDHISVANADLFISYRTFPQSGRAPRQSRPAIILRSGGFVFWIAAARPRSIHDPCSGVLDSNRGAFRGAIGRDARLSMIFSENRYPLFPDHALAPTPSWTLIGDSHAGRGSIGLSRGHSARHSFDRSCGNSICSNDVQSRTLNRLRQWTCGVWGWRCTGGRVCARVAFRCRFGCPGRRSGWCRLRR